MFIGVTKSNHKKNLREKNYIKRYHYYFICEKRKNK